MEVTRGLVRAAYQKSIEIGIENVAIIIEPSLMRLLGMLGFVLEPICQPTKYFGGFTQVALVNIARSEEMWRSKKPELSNYYQGGSVFSSSAMVG